MSENKIPSKATADLIESLSLNKNIVNFDIRDNPCYNDALRAKIAIRLVKNIDALKKRKEILKKSWINIEVLKIEIPQDMKEAIKEVYGVEVNEDQVEAEDKIMGRPTLDNFRTYHTKSFSKNNKLKKKNTQDHEKLNTTQISHDSNNLYGNLSQIKENSSPKLRVISKYMNLNSQKLMHSFRISSEKKQKAQ